MAGLGLFRVFVANKLPCKLALNKSHKIVPLKSSVGSLSRTIASKIVSNIFDNDSNWSESVFLCIVNSDEIPFPSNLAS